ncbi:helix-turn-helix transcriptional regulator [Mucilaginibacter sp.]|uniref:helix-turn-helix domain-containing protein n=1 Tax=Mucilaginibacter sp. TaxID=1882438 RepID=UPI0025EF3199|nr:helix-turn-helix transcriptional regulator [Mucilaginibacter sp.]
MGNPGLQIKKLRQYFNLTQDQFAVISGTKRNSIAMIESGRNKPTFELIADISTVFNLSADFFLSDDNPAAFESAFEFITIKKKGIENNKSEDILNVTVKHSNDVTVNRKKDKKNKELSLLIDDMSTDDINQSLVKVAQSNLLYIEFHLMDIELNLKLLREKLTGDKFDRKQYDESLKKITNACKTLKNVIKSGYTSNAAIVGFLLNQDELMRGLLDNIRELSKDLYLNN